MQVAHMPWDVGVAKMIAGAAHLRCRDTMLQAEYPHFILLKISNRALDVLWCVCFFFSPFALNYSVVEVSKIKDF